MQPEDRGLRDLIIAGIWGILDGLALWGLFAIDAVWSGRGLDFQAPLPLVAYLVIVATLSQVLFARLFAPTTGRRKYIRGLIASVTTLAVIAYPISQSFFFS